MELLSLDTLSASLQSMWVPISVGLFLLAYLLYYIRFRKPHFVIKSDYEVKKKNIGRPPPPYPNGWYNVLLAAHLQKGTVKNIDIAGQNIVLFRGEDGVAYALEAYCLHMGAHLGVGGEVVNKTCVQCPFHGWLYDGKSGHCVGISSVILRPRREKAGTKISGVQPWDVREGWQDRVGHGTSIEAEAEEISGD